MMKFKNIASALDRFEEATIAHSNAIEVGDYKTANKNYGVIINALRYLKANNELCSIEKFLHHNNVGVRAWAATYLLDIDVSQAIKVLEEIANANGPRSLAAKTAITEWQGGRLNLFI